MKITAVAFLCSTSLLFAPAGAQVAASSVGGSGMSSSVSHSPSDTQSLVNQLTPAELQDAINALKTNYFNPGSISDGELQRAMLSGILARLAPGASLRSLSTAPAEAPAPFKSEIIYPSSRGIAYFRLGSLTKANLDQLDAALKDLSSQGITSLILDLRATTESSDYPLAAELLQRFCPKGSTLFSIKKGTAQGVPAKPSISDQEPSFKGVLMVLVDCDNAAASEVIATSLRFYAKAILIGQKTKGEGVEFSDFKVGPDKILRVAVAEVTGPEGSAIYPHGVKPDIIVEVSPEDTRKVLDKGLAEGISGLIFETERPRMNEASLVAGTNPEVDAYQNAQRAASEKQVPQLHDAVLQRAVDLITSIGVFAK